MGKAEISWKGRNEEGIRREVYVKHVGNEWRFFVRENRFDNWEPMPEPPFEDWLELLDGVRRRVQRRLVRPEAEVQVRKQILDRFPGTKL